MGLITELSGMCLFFFQVDYLNLMSQRRRIPHAERVAKTCVAERVLCYRCTSEQHWALKLQDSFSYLLQFDPVYNILLLQFTLLQITVS